MKVRGTKHLTKRQRSQISEKELASIVGGRVQIASGAMPVACLKGDVKTAHHLFDDKTTLAKSYSLKLEDWRKIRKQAFQAGNKQPVMRVNFEGENTSLYVVSELDFIRLLRAYKSVK